MSTQNVNAIPTPLPYNDKGTALGHYQVVAVTGTMAAGLAAGAPIFSCYWAPAIETRVAIIQEIVIEEFRSLTGFTAGAYAFILWHANVMTAVATGGAAVVLTTVEAQLRTAKMGASLMADMRVATTATLTAGAGEVLDTRPTSSVRGGVGTAANQGIIPAPVGVVTAEVYSGPGIVLYKADIANGEHPLVLDTGQGFVIDATVPATGTWIAALRVKWAEAEAYSQ